MKSEEFTDIMASLTLTKRECLVQLLGGKEQPPQHKRVLKRPSYGTINNKPPAKRYSGAAVWSESKKVTVQPFPALYYCGACARRLRTMEELEQHRDKGFAHWPFFGEWKFDIKPTLLETDCFTKGQVARFLEAVAGGDYVDTQLGEETACATKLT